jgi:hypothetical protein
LLKKPEVHKVSATQPISSEVEFKFKSVYLPNLSFLIYGIPSSNLYSTTHNHIMKNNYNAKWLIIVGIRAAVNATV